MIVGRKRASEVHQPDAAQASLVTLLAATNLAAKVSVVDTRRVAAALAVYNVVLFTTRVIAQMYAPLVGWLRDQAVRLGAVETLEPALRLVLVGTLVGTALAWLLIPSFVTLYNRAVAALERHGSVPVMILAVLRPGLLGKLSRCAQLPPWQDVTFADVRAVPVSLVVASTLVVAVQNVGMLAAVNAGAQLGDQLARSAMPLSALVNGFAAVLLAVVVDPATARITDDCVSKRRPVSHIRAVAVELTAAAVLGALLS